MIPRPEISSSHTFPPHTVVCCQVQVQGVLPQARSLGHLGWNLAVRGVTPPPPQRKLDWALPNPRSLQTEFCRQSCYRIPYMPGKINVTKDVENPLFRGTGQLRSYPRPNVGPSARVLLPSWFGFYWGFGHWRGFRCCSRLWPLSLCLDRSFLCSEDIFSQPI